jgi:hypothetical protein
VNLRDASDDIFVRTEKAVSCKGKFDCAYRSSPYALVPGGIIAFSPTLFHLLVSGK